MFTPQEFNQKVELKTTPAKSIFWKLVWGIVKPWLYANAKELLGLLLEHFFGKTKAFKVINQLGEEEPVGCVGDKPTGVPDGSSPNGKWECIRGEWKYIEQI